MKIKIICALKTKKKSETINTLNNNNYFLDYKNTSNNNKIFVESN